MRAWSTDIKSDTGEQVKRRKKETEETENVEVMAEKQGRKSRKRESNKCLF